MNPPKSDNPPPVNLPVGTPDPELLASGLKTAAAALGLDDCRVAAIHGPAPHAQEFQQWLDHGEHGEMDWMARNPHRRKDPREVLPGPKGAQHHSPGQRPRNSGPKGAQHHSLGQRPRNAGPKGAQPHSLGQRPRNRIPNRFEP